MEPISVRSLDGGDLHRAWKSVLRRYSHHSTPSLANPTDLRLAMSDWASFVGDMLQAQYISGFWVDRLYYSLPWKTVYWKVLFWIWSLYPDPNRQSCWVDLWAATSMRFSS